MGLMYVLYQRAAAGPSSLSLLKHEGSICRSTCNILVAVQLLRLLQQRDPAYWEMCASFNVLKKKQKCRRTNTTELGGLWEEGGWEHLNLDGLPLQCICNC